jgi:hypothetical protein
MRLILASALLLLPLHAEAETSVPNDCWSGVMAPDKGPGEYVATGPVAQWRVGTSLVVYSTKESPEEVADLLEKGQAGTFDTSRPIAVVPTWITGPEPVSGGEPDEAGRIRVLMLYRTAQGETGTISLTYWTPMSNQYFSLLLSDQQATMAQVDQQAHDLLCRGVP